MVLGGELKFMRTKDIKRAFAIVRNRPIYSAQSWV